MVARLMLLECEARGGLAVPTLSLETLPIGREMALQSFDIEQYLEGRSLGSFRWVVLICCFLIVAIDGLNTAVMGFVAPSLIRDWGVSKTAIAPVMSAALFGLAIGALVAGPLADRHGRKPVILASVALFGLSSFLGVAAHSPPAMAVLRLITGLGLGAAMPNAVTLMNEISPKSRRLFLGTLMFCGFTIGSSLAGVIASFLIPNFGWTSVFGVTGTTSLVLVPLLALLLPESPLYLLAKGRHSDALVVLRKIGTIGPAEAQILVTDKRIDYRSPTVRALFQNGAAATTLLLWLTYFMGLLVVYLLTSWLPLLMQQNGATVRDSSLVTAMFMLGSTIGTIFMGWLMDFMSKFLILCAGFITAAFFVLLIALNNSETSLLIWLVLGAGAGMGSVTSMPVLAAGVYDTYCRATGVGWMLGIGRFGGILGATSGGLLMDLGWNFQTIFLLLVVPAMFAAAATAMMNASQRKMRAA